jgi:hypothetical protein
VKGRYEIKLESVFSAGSSLYVDVTKDTTFVLRSPYRFQAVDMLTKDELAVADTIGLTYRSDGCWHKCIERSKVVRITGTDTYRLTIDAGNSCSGKNSYEVEYKVTASVIDSLVALQLNSRMPEQKPGQPQALFFSTSMRRIYIKANNKVYRFSDRGLKDWNAYDRFRKGLNLEN